MSYDPNSLGLDLSGHHPLQLHNIQEQQQQQQQQQHQMDIQDLNLQSIVPIQKTIIGTSNSQGSKPPSNEFVRKLYNILESNSYPDIVRWTDTGDSFVVLDTGKFTTQILPNHFKHSNFASFVRQLNKYDFHKIKRKPNEGPRSQNGELSWEFKHPFFKIHDESGLDHIKRKLTNAKKTSEINNNYSNKNDILISGSNQLGMTKQQFLNHTVSKESFTTLRKRVDFLEKQLEVCKNDVFIGKVEYQKLNSKYNTVVESLITFKTVNENLINNFNILCSTLTNSGIKLPDGFYEQSSFVRNSSDIQKDRIDENDKSSSNNNSMTPNIKTDMNLINTSNDISGSLSTGQSKNLSPTNAQSSTNVLLNNQRSGLVGSQSIKQDSNMENTGSTILRKGFHVLLVEDDAISIQLCSKFLRKYGCTVEVVSNGLSAISTLEKFRFDLVLMDIVMPNLDGATATSIIRSFDNQTPIIAMTGNIDDQDLITYLQHGMNDILAKPFTRDDLHTMLVRYLRNRIPLSEQERVQLPTAPHVTGDHGSSAQSQSQPPPTQLPIQHQSHVSSQPPPDHMVHEQNDIPISLAVDVNNPLPTTGTESPQDLLDNNAFLEDEHIEKKQHV